MTGKYCAICECTTSPITTCSICLAKTRDKLRTAITERDRLAAENADLKATDQYQRSLDEMHLRYNVEAELATANATLDQLREVVPDNSGAWCEECCACVELGGEYATCMVCGEMPDDESSATWLMNKLQAILYPPETNHDHK